MRRPTLHERFERRYIPEPNSGCWLWVGRIGKSRYPRMFADGRTRSAHRISWELFHGEIPDGLCVCHKCDVPSCVNPGHMFLGTRSDNMSDCKHKGRLRYQKGTEVWTNKLTPSQVMAIRVDKRLARIIAVDYGVGARHVNRIKQVRYWKHLIHSGSPQPVGSAPDDASAKAASSHNPSARRAFSVHPSLHRGNT